MIILILSTNAAWAQLNIDWANKISADSDTNDFCNAIRHDASGNILVVGSFSGVVDIDPSAATFYVSIRGGLDMYLAKFDTTGTLIWAKTMGGFTDDIPYDVVTDNLGNIYITGSCSNLADFDGGADTAFLKPNGSSGNTVIFLAKYTSNGDYLWAKVMGGSGYGFGKRVKIDQNGEVILVGNFKVTIDFDPSPNVLNLSEQGSNFYDIFISKFTSNGDLRFAKRIGGGDYDEVNGLTLDQNGNLYITGYFMLTVDFDPGPAVFNMSVPINDKSSFVAKYDSLGIFVSAGGQNGKAGYDLLIDPLGKLRVSGYYKSGSSEIVFLNKYIFNDFRSI